MPKFEIKNALFGYFGLEFENNISYMKSYIVIFEICVLEFALLQSLVQT